MRFLLHWNVIGEGVTRICTYPTPVKGGEREVERGGKGGEERQIDEGTGGGEGSGERGDGRGETY